MSATPANLLDVNVLVAAAWPSHQFHRAAHDWLAGSAQQTWASCALTQAAFVRLSCNPKVFRDAVTPVEAARVLGLITQHHQHRYWSECPGIPQLALWPQLVMTGHRQVTDAYLLALAHHHGGKLVTFDRGVAELLTTATERKRWVELIVP